MIAGTDNYGTAIPAADREIRMSAAWKARLTWMFAVALIATMTTAPAAFADFEITEFDGSTNNTDGSVSTQAGAHPFSFTTKFSVSGSVSPDGDMVPDENPRDVQVQLPAGLVGNPTAMPQCTVAQLADTLLIPPFNRCPVESQVGIAEVDFTLGGPEPMPVKLPVYNMVAPLGSPGLFGFNLIAFPTFIHANLRAGDDYGVTAEMANVSQATPFVGASLTLWGDPADPAHDAERGLYCEGGNCGGGGESSLAPRKAFLTNPMNCAAGPLSSTLRIDSWQNIGHFEEARFVSHLPDGTPTGVTGCSRVPFDPAAVINPTTTSADAPTGLSVDLTVPQSDAAGDLAQAYLKKATVMLPEGMSINPAAAGGLVGCSVSQIGFRGAIQGLDRYSPDPPNCPNASKIGSVELETPLLDHPLKGSVFAAAQRSNPFGSLLAVYVVVHDPKSGVVIKLAGRIAADPNSGRLTAVFDDNPQLPFSSLNLHFFGGSRAVLRTPPSCGIYTSTAEFSPWSAANPDNPAPFETVTSVSSFTIDRGPGGGPCPAQAFDPKLRAGTINPVAGRFSPMSFQLTREDGTQELKSLAVSLPQGLLAKLAGVPYCAQAQIDAALARSGEGLGATELSSSSCPAASQIGTVAVGAGAGTNPLYVNTGKAYLAGPYRGAPLSLVIVMPAIAGPFDLGAVVVRTALLVDRRTAAVRAVSDPIPPILAGIPLNIRDMRIDMDRTDFILNPTSCEPMEFSGLATALSGATAPLSDRFQVGSCERLGFAPKLSLRLRGSSKRGGYPALRVVAKAKKGQANIGKVSVALPRSEFLENAHINTICTRAQFASDTCPRGSIYGYAKAFTPLLDQPLKGPVYLKSSSNLLPDLVASLEGPPSQPIHLDLTGRIDSVNGGIRNIFNVVPDAPVSKFILTMKGGGKGLLVNSRDICARTYRATVKMDGQNGKIHDTKPQLKASCGKNGKKKGKRLAQRSVVR